MCGRYVLKTPAKVLAERFGADTGVLPERVERLAPRYNVAPGQEVLAVLSDGERRRMGLLRWGLVPSWADDPRVGNRMINARAETVAEKPAYRSAFRRRRCLVPADAYYEWKAEGSGPKTPHLFRLSGGEPFAFAGLWERWSSGGDGAGEDLLTCAIITAEASPLAREVHHRMPVLLGEEAAERWLDPAAPGDELLSLLAPYGGGDLEAYPVDRRVNDPRNEGAALAEPAA